MSVASGVEFGDACMAALGQLPQVIGNIETVIGCGTISRASGIAVQVMVGDPVCRGDGIETAADGLIEIRFIDGTVFTLSRDTRVVLSEFARDSNGTLRSALFAVTRGTFAFIAGQLATTGSLTVDTPVGSIRSRAQAGGVGMLSLAALTFALMKEVQAADPNVSFLDDDSIAYKDLDHGVFELVTKEAIPRHIIVEDPGETVVLTRRGSSVSVNQVANSPARMEELQAAQQEALASFAKGLGHSGSSAPPFSNPQLEVQPINFIQGDSDSPAPEDSLPPIQATLIPVPDIFVLPLPPPTVAITSIAGQIGIAADNIINAARANAGVEITGATSGVADGRIVTVTIVDSSDHVVYSGTATVTNSTWSINLDPPDAKALADGIYTLTADTTNAAGDPAEATRTIRVDETPPTIAIHAIVSNNVNNVVNANAASAGFAIAGTTTDAENGQPVTVQIVDSSGHVVDTFTTTLTNNSWSVNVSSSEAKLLHDGSYTVTANVSDSAGNPAPQATQAITVDETPPTLTGLAQAESGIEGTTIALGAITATVNSLPDHSDSVQSLVVSGIPAGAVLTDGTNSFMATSGNTSIDVKSWNLSNLKITPPNDTNFSLTVTATDQDANTASASELVTVAPPAPYLSPVAARGNEGTAISLDLGVMAKSLSGANGDAIPNSLDTLVVSDIPVGATLSDGTGLPGHSFTATADNTSHDVASWNLSSLNITPPAEFEGCFKLTIAASERDSEGDISTTVKATEVVTVAPVAEPPTASAPKTATTAANTAIDISGVVAGPAAEDADDRVIVRLTVAHGTLAVCPVAGVTETVNWPGSLTLSGTASEVNTALVSLVYTPTRCFTGCDTLKVSVTSQDGSDTNPTEATAATAIRVTPDSESLIVGGPGPTLDWNDPANWSGAVVPTLSIRPASQAFPSSPTKSAGDHGTFPMTAAGVWAHTLDNGGASFDEGGTPSTEDSVVAAAITLPSGISIEPPHLAVTAPMQTSFAFDQQPVSDSADATTIDHGAVMHGPILESGESIALSGSDWKFPKNAGPMNDGDTHAHEIDTSPYVALDSGVLKTPESDSGNHSIAGDAGKHAAPMHGAGVHDFEPSFIAQVGSGGTVGTPGDSFHFKDEISGSKGSRVTDVAEPNDIRASESHHDDAAGTHGPLAISGGRETPGAPGDSFHFKDEISGSKGSRVTDVAELNGIPASMSHHEDAAGTHGPLAISERAQAIGLPSPEQYPDDELHIFPHHAPSALVTHVAHDLIV
jgi:Bacterial Ig-like domain/FecR protein